MRRPRGEREQHDELPNQEFMVQEGERTRIQLLKASQLVCCALRLVSCLSCLGSASALSPPPVYLPWPVSHRSKNAVDSFPHISHSHPSRLLIRFFLSLFPRFCEQQAKCLHTINEPRVTDPNLRLTSSRMFPLRIFISPEDTCGQSMLFSDL